MRPLLISAVALSFTAVASAQQITETEYVKVCESGTPETCQRAVESFIDGAQGRIDRSRFAQVAIQELTRSVCNRRNTNSAAVTRGITRALTVPSRGRAIRSVQRSANSCAQMRTALLGASNQVTAVLGVGLAVLRPSPN